MPPYISRELTTRIIKRIKSIERKKSYIPSLIAACAAASLAIGTLNGEQET